jgi:sugar phosphate isomerase/epimerase
MMEPGVMSSLTENARGFETVAEFGVRCCQVVSWDMSLCRLELAKKSKKAAADAGVRVSAFWAGVPGPAAWNFTQGPLTLGLVPPEFRWARMEALKRWADFAVELGAPAIVTHCGFLPENLTDPDFGAVAVAIRDVAAHCKKLGIGFWFETGQETPVTLLRYIDEIGLDNLGINLDPANLLMYGRGNPIDALDVFGKHVRCVHAKDGHCPTNSKQLGHEVRVGTGAVRFPEFIRKLHDVGYKGDLVIEREIHGEQQRVDIAQTVADLRAWVAALGG